ncbi:MAG: hypothetical protein LW822_09035 [Phycisphaeraceae bacterium]|jgi:hypothetical protein|nr:hypothetical protein [Phycisphaeraceae bacterium]
MMMWTSIPFFLIVALVLYSLIRMIISEAGIRREVAKPPQCGSCKHEATLQMIASGRCPECGSAYLVAGIDGPLMRLQRHTKNNGIYVAFALFGILPGISATLILTQGTFLRGYGPWSGMGIFLTFVLVLTLTPSLLIAWRRKRIRDGIMRAMAPPAAPSRIITKTDANTQPDRLESSPPTGDSSPVSPPSPTQGTP